MNESNSGSGSFPSNCNAGNAGNFYNGGASILTDGTQQICQEVPFLITHWLANYGISNSSGYEEIYDRERSAMATIRRAASEIASAFTSLGAYGTTIRSSLELSTSSSLSSSFLNQPVVQNRTFRDLNRMYAELPRKHLEHLAQSMAVNNATIDSTALENASSNYLLRVTSTRESAIEDSSATVTAGGLTNNSNRPMTDNESLQETTKRDMSDEFGKVNVCSRESIGGCNNQRQSILQKPALIMSRGHHDWFSAMKKTNSRDNISNRNNKKNQGNSMVETEHAINQPPSIDVKSAHWEVAHQTAEVVREFLNLRERYRSISSEMHSLRASVVLQRRKSNKLEEEMNTIHKNSTIAAVEKIERIEKLKTDHQASDRVISQLTRKLTELNSRERSMKPNMSELELHAQSLDKRRRSIENSFHDPFQSWKGSLSKSSRIGECMVLKSIVGREFGLSRRRSSKKQFGSSLRTGICPIHFGELRKNLLLTRLSHAVTINAHLNYPVYCLRFDRTGRYFITGADDFLLKVFYIGAAQSCKVHDGMNTNRRLRCNYGANFRGSVLVCTLKGHAGVINDINVSMDNCFLATASDDGDVRVWGLKNGCPVAILRGHKGGANIVSWSKLTPYRLVSTGSDGFARVWDIREACLKRYANVVGHRGEYNLRLTNEEEKVKNEFRSVSQKTSGKSLISHPLPPLPIRGGSLSSLPSSAAHDNITLPTENMNPAAYRSPLPPDTSQVGVPSEQLPSRNIDNNIGNENENGIMVPPLPVVVPPLDRGADDGNQDVGGIDGEAIPGQFVANDLIDEGVRLLLKYQHGNIHEEHGPGTRSQRSSVNVLCVARCPLGKQFVTGSDDGICRVWEDFDDSAVAIIDSRLSNRTQEKVFQSVKPPQSGVESQPLLKLMGHVSTITDLAYSYVGDRILSASQKDGVVRVWNIGTPTALGRGDKIVFKDKRVTQIVIKLINPSSNKISKPNRRRLGNAARNASSKVCCDVAVWTHDDSYVVTSQSVPLKENGTDIQPGSLFICMWDSKSGRCLVCISGAHTSQCPVVLPHPMDSSILCTASTDGFVKVWNWIQGKCVFNYQNKNESRQQDISTKIGGYLDGSFSPDGNTIVLTDDTGQITVLDSISKEDDPPNTGNELPWMREQYFANDYYDLIYDRNGYCIERGSERPPHLAPKSARCAQNGAAYSDEINEAFQRLSGPSPLPESLCTWNREQIRAQRFSNKYFIHAFKNPGVRVSIREFDLMSTIVIKGIGHMNENENLKTSGTNRSAFESSSSPRGGERIRRAPTRTMSDNYRYLDYDDLVRREGNLEDDEPDSDDEEFQPVAVRRNVTNDDVESEDDELDDASIYSENNNRRWSRQRNHTSSRTTEERRARAQRRAHRNDTDFLEIDSDDEMITQFVSSNRTPTGPYMRDYTLNGHYWRLKSISDVNRVCRKWLHREESDSTYFGRNVYTPQMGDSIVYIPRAHFETIKECPSLSPPWQNWPVGAVWPVVRCFIRGIRFRFPFEDYFRNKRHAKCSSIVAILTLEVTGIPEICGDREFPWPKPSFVEPTRPFLFELSVFENSSCEYVVPEILYASRICALENHIRSRSHGVAGLEVDLYYEQEQGDSDLQVWPATVEEILPDEGHSDVHLQGSGFGVLQVWDGSEQNRDYVSPWELNTEGVNLNRPCMSNHEKESVLQELNRFLREDEIVDHLNMPVDQERYCDYANMIEIPMDIMFIKRRLATNFYGSKLGVAADIRLIRDNCIKYNTDDNVISEIATRMCNEFEENVLSRDECSQMITENDFDKIYREQSEGRQLPNVRIRLSARAIQEASQSGASSGGTYTLRGRMSTQGHSSLENLPAPDIGQTQRQRNRRAVERNNNALEVNNSRSRGMNGGAEQVLGLVSRPFSGRRDVSNTGRSMNNSSDTFGNQNANSGDATVRNLRRRNIPDSNGSSHRRRVLTRNVESQNNLHESSPSVEGDNEGCDDEEIIATTFRSNMARRSSRDTFTRGLQEFNAETHLGLAVSIRDSKRSRLTRGDGSRYNEQEEGESEEDDNDNGTESEQKGGNSDDESYHTDQGDNHSASSGGSEVVDSPPPVKKNRTSPRTTRTALRMAEPAVESSMRRLSQRNAAKRRISYEDVQSDTEDDLSNSEDSKKYDFNKVRRASSRKNLAKRHASYKEAASDEDNSKDSKSYDANQVRSSGRTLRVSLQIEESRRRRSSRRSSTKKHASNEEIGPGAEEHLRRSEDSESTCVNQAEESMSPCMLQQVDKLLERRSSRRKTKKRHASYEEVDSDTEGHESYSDNSESDNVRHLLNYGCGSSLSYTEHGDDMTEKVETSSTKRTATKRKRQVLKLIADMPTKKLTTKKKLRNRVGTLPELRTWPTIEVGDISQVTKEMLKKISEDDASGIFSIPVIEAHPAIADAYLDLIDTPMDLRTIEEDRVNMYSSIYMLQDDLVLMFRNCCVYNGSNSDLGRIAITQWDDINHKFCNVCEDLGIVLPRRWKA